LPRGSINSLDQEKKLYLGTPNRRSGLGILSVNEESDTEFHNLDQQAMDVKEDQRGGNM
jgi:hypothetical protein